MTATLSLDTLPHRAAQLATSLLVLALSLLTVTLANAQKDPAARADLQALRQKYTNSGAIDAQVQLDIKFPEAPAESQSGRIVQDGDKYFIQFAGQEVTSDGETMWLYLPDNKEVQVYDAAEMAGEASGGFTRPQDILDLYDSGAFDYAIVGTATAQGREMKQIEFKPLERDSEFAKMRLTYDDVRDEIYRIEIFNKDGSRFTLTMKEVSVGAEVPASTFVFAEKPGVRVEDMRL